MMIEWYENKKNGIGGIYTYYFRNTGMDDCEQSYVGSTTNLNSRHKQHIKALRTNKHPNYRFQEAYNLYAESNMEYYVFDEIFFPNSYDRNIKRELLECRESYYKEFLNSRYNLADPAKNYSEQITKIRKKELTANKKRKVFLVDKDLNVLKEYASTKEACSDLNVHPFCVKKVALLQSKCTKGYIFRFLETLEKVCLKKKFMPKGFKNFGIRRAIICYNLSCEFVSEYSGICEASERLGIPISTISNSCKFRVNNINGYIFRYKNCKEPVVYIPKKYKKRKIVCYLNGSFYKEYDNCAQAGKDLGIRRATVLTSANKSRLYKNKYLFKFKNQQHESILS